MPDLCGRCLLVSWWVWIGVAHVPAWGPALHSGRAESFICVLPRGCCSVSRGSLSTGASHRHSVATLKAKFDNPGSSREGLERQAAAGRARCQRRVQSRESPLLRLISDRQAREAKALAFESSFIQLMTVCMESRRGFLGQGGYPSNKCLDSSVELWRDNGTPRRSTALYDITPSS